MISLLPWRPWASNCQPRPKYPWRTSQNSGEERLNPTTFEPWTDNANLILETHRSSLKQGLHNLMSRGIKKDPSKEKEQTFQEIQQILLAFAREWGEGRRTFMLMDEDQEWGVLIQILAVLKVNSHTPLYMLSFRTIFAIPNKSLQRQMEDILPPSVTYAISVRTTPLERKVVLKLLNMNAKRLDTEVYKVPEGFAKYTKKQWKVSFILPLAPLPMVDIGKFTDLSGCEVCGSTKGASRCSGCLSVLYCGTKCQTEDWPRHKATCKSLQGGTWTTITFGPASAVPSIGGLDTNKTLYSTLMNFNESTHGSSSSHNRIKEVQPSDIPPNVHGSKVFLAKFQVSLFQFGPQSHFLIYDRQRSFQIFWKAKEDMEAFQVAMKALGDELKMYRFVKRTGDYSMSVCFDRPPAENPPW
ncbi:hypothetical protein CC2G_012090 [Coprinopsis cinerea AmutBmut pab1-1]|nr:hypothetical protein CC2G_012090 [Coprinopsis cinerea AmutBmut pab1-1]